MRSSIGLVTHGLSPSGSKKFSLFYFLLVINLCTSSFNGDKNNFNNNNYFTTHHPLRHHRHHALNRTHTNNDTTRSPIESVRNFLSSREYDTKRNYYRATTTIFPPVTTKRPVFAHKSKINTVTKENPPSPYQTIQRNHRNIENYQKVKEKTFDDIIREISQFKKRKRFHKTTTTTTTTPDPLEDDYEDYDDEDFQDDEAMEPFNHQNGFLLPERQTSSERYVTEKKQDIRQIQNDPPLDNYHPGDLTQLKFTHFGNHEAVKNQFQTYVESQPTRRSDAWQHHYRRNMIESRCKDPKPQVFPSSNDPTRLYTPRCTVLYRCSDDTACCPSVDKTCVARTKDWIELAFMVHFPLNGTNIQIFESFENHTSCHCVLKSQVASSRNPPAPIVRPKQCNCPRIFTEVIEDNGNCKCECLSHECQMKRKGQEHFSMDERSCISRGLCKRPRCDFGHYITQEGRCPRREEKFDALTSNHRHQSRLH